MMTLDVPWETEQNCVFYTFMQETVFAQFLFTLYTFDVSAGSCHIQKYLDDTATVARIQKRVRKRKGSW